MAREQATRVARLERDMTTLRRKLESHDRDIKNIRKSIASLNELISTMRVELEHSGARKEHIRS